MSKIFGVPASPFVRKVMLAHAYKDMDFQLVMVNPGSDDETFREASPFGKIPGYQSDKGTNFADSSVIIAYLEKVNTDSPLYPDDSEDYARALWFEEFSDSKLGEACNALYFQKVVGPKFFNHTTDDTRVTQIIEELLPPVLGYLNEQIKHGQWIINNTISIADIAVGSFLIGLLHAKYDISTAKYPNTADFFKRFVALDFVSAQLDLESSMLFAD
jgi:glutathione S-transferase